MSIARLPHRWRGTWFERWGDLLAVSAYAAALCVAYIVFVHPEYEYMQFYLSPSFTKGLEAFGLSVIVFFMMPRRERTPSAITMQIFFLLLILPLSVLYVLGDELRFFHYFYIIGFIATAGVLRLLPAFRIPQFRRRHTVLFVMLGAVSLVTYVLMYRLNGLPSLRALNIQNVYDIRETYEQGSILVQYLRTWQAKIINCFLLGIAWYHRKHLLFALVVCGQMYLYLVTAHKIYLIYPVVLFIMLYAARRRSFFRPMAWVLAATVLAVLAMYLVADDVMPASLVVRRGLFVPAQNTYVYGEYFASQPLLYLSESTVGFGLYQSRYPSVGLNIAQIIADEMRGTESNMNASYLANGYANFGVVGILMYSVLLGLLLKLFDAINPTHPALLVALAVMPLLSFLNSGFFVTVFTHGVLLNLMILLLYFGSTGGKRHESNPADKPRPA